MNLKPFLFMSLLSAQICFGSDLPARLEAYLEARGVAFPRASTADEIDPGLLAALKSKSGTHTHFYLSEEVLGEFFPAKDAYETHAYFRPGHLGACSAHAMGAVTLEGDTSHLHARRTLAHILALVESLTGPESFDLAYYQSKLYPHFLRFLDAKNEDESFQLTHLGIFSDVLEKMSNDESGQKLLSQNTSLKSLRLYGVFTPGTLRALASLPHLTHLDLSQVIFCSEYAPLLIASLQEMPLLTSFKAPSFAREQKMLNQLRYISPLTMVERENSYRTLAEVEKNYLIISKA